MTRDPDVFDPSYSPDVEIDEHGRAVFTRDLPAGSLIRIPLHIVPRIGRPPAPFRYARILPRE